jgi:hypothetical protein
MALAFSGCSKKEEPKQQAENLNPNTHKAVVEEVLQVAQYTYLRVKEGDQELWLAGNKMDVQTGATVYYEGAMEMKNFESKALNKKFDSVFFVQTLSTQPIGMPVSPHGTDGMKATPQKPSIEKVDVSVAPAKGGVTISKLYANPSSYDGKTVLISGKITKVNNGIMQKNWVHIQDGTSNGGDYDLTITTNDMVQVGDVVTFQGKVALNKDFGYGYSYKIMLEEAKTLKNL